MTHPSPSPEMSSLWLLPARQDEALLSGIVERLVERHASPRFQPHLTLVGDLPVAPEHLIGAAERLAEAGPALDLPVSGIETGEAFFRSFYAAFPASPALSALREAALRLPQAPSGAFMPHVSLLYGPVEAGAKARSAAEIAALLGGRVIRFDRLALTNSANDVPIADWRAIATLPLSGPVQRA